MRLVDTWHGSVVPTALVVNESFASGPINTLRSVRPESLRRSAAAFDLAQSVEEAGRMGRTVQLVALRSCRLDPCDSSQ